MKRRFYILFIAAIVFATLCLTVSCFSKAEAGDDDDDDAAGDPPGVINTEPVDGEDELKLATTVVVTFNELMNKQSVEENFQIEPEVNGRFEWYGGGDEVTFIPEPRLKEDVHYIVKIGEGAKDLSGERMEGPYEFGFDTVNLWTRSHNGPGQADDEGYGIAVDDQGNVYVTGYVSKNNTDTEAWLGKYDKDGVEQWIQTYAGAAMLMDFGTDLVLDGDGNLYVSGVETSPAGDRNIWVAKYNNDGDLKWRERHEGAFNGDDECNCIALGNDGNLYVAGYETAAETDADIWVRKYSADGEEMWTARHNDVANGFDAGSGIGVDSEGNAYIGGVITHTHEHLNTWLGKFDSQGGERWAVTHNGSENGNDVAMNAVVDDEDNIYSCGYISVPGQQTDIWLSKYDKGGNELWTYGYGSPWGGNDLCMGITTDHEGNIYMTGALDTQGSIEGWVAKLNNQGQEVWSLTHDFRFGMRVTVDERGNVYVIGYMYEALENLNIWIGKYDTDGNWSDD